MASLHLFSSTSSAPLPSHGPPSTLSSTLLPPPSPVFSSFLILLFSTHCLLFCLPSPYGPFHPPLPPPSPPPLKEHGWLKPQVILVEGDPVPEGVDPRTVRFIPAKHPFALASVSGRHRAPGRPLSPHCPRDAHGGSRMHMEAVASERSSSRDMSVL